MPLPDTEVQRALVVAKEVSVSDVRYLGYVDHFDVKLTALLAHDSQHPDPDRLYELMHTKLTDTAVELGLDAGRLAEKFAVYPVP